MPNPGEQTLQQNTHQEPITIRQSLTELQTWDLADQQTVEERRTQERTRMLRAQREANERLTQRAESSVPPVQAQTVAQGTPVQEQKPAKKTFKQRRQDKKMAKEAQKRSNKNADHVSYRMVEQLEDLRERENHTLTPERLAEAERAGVDRRVLRSFIQGYRTNKQGEPATEEDQQRKEADDQFLDAYISGDVERRRPYLQRFAQELLDVPITASMLTDEYMETHAAELKNLGDRMTYFENIQNDPINKPFFDAMPRMQLDLLNAKLNALTANFSGYFIARAEAKSVDANRFRYYGEDLNLEDAKFKESFSANLFAQGLQEWNTASQQIYENTVEQEMQEEEQELLRGSAEMKAILEQEAGDLSGLGLNNFATLYSYEYMRDLRNVIEQNPENYAAFKGAADGLYQDAYRLTEARGDVLLKVAAYQGVIDRNMNMNDPHEAAIRKMADQKREQYTEESDRLQERASMYKNAIEFFMKDSKLLNSGKLLIESQGYQKEYAKKMFIGKGGFVEASNAAYQSAATQNKTAKEIRSAALMGLGIRTSSSEAAQADKMYRGDTYAKISGDYAAYFHELENDSSVNLSEIKYTRTQWGAGAYNEGEGFNDIPQHMMGMFLEYLTSPASVQYFREMVPNIKDAAVFGGNAESAAEYLAQGLANSFGAQFTGVSEEAAAGNYKDGATVRTIARESCRTILTIAGMPGQINGDDEAKLPEAIKNMLDQYRDAVRSVVNQL